MYSHHTLYEERYGSWSAIHIVSTHVRVCACRLPLNATWQRGVSPGHWGHGFGRDVLCKWYRFLLCLGLHTGPVLLVGTPSSNSGGGIRWCHCFVCYALNLIAEKDLWERLSYFFEWVYPVNARRVLGSCRVTDMVTSTNAGIRKGVGLSRGTPSYWDLTKPRQAPHLGSR